MDQASQESERQLRLIFENTGTAISIFDTDCRVIRQNSQSIAQLGITGAVARRLHVVELFGEGRGALIEARMKQVLASGSPQTFDTSFELPSGRKTFRSTYQPLLDGAAVVGLQIISQDITEQVRTQQALIENELQFRTFFELAADLVSIAGFDGVFQKINPAGQALLGYDEKTLLSRPFTDFMVEDDREKTFQVMGEQLAHGKTVVGFENRYLRPDGSIRYLEWTARPDLERGLIFSVARDVTDRSRQAAEAAARDEQLRKSQKLESLGSLAGGIAHDFNNILTGILGFVELAQMVGDHEKRKYYLGKVVEGCQRAQGLTRQLLTFAKGGAPVFQVVDPGELVDRQVRFASHGTSATVKVSLAPGLPAVLCDPEQVSQVVSNLVINALQAMGGEGRLDVTVTAEARMVVCRFADTGPGIPSELLDKIFDPFFTTKADGSGLGLSICHSIVDRHGGDLSVSSPPGSGAVFTLSLPAAAEEPNPVALALPSTFRGQGLALILDDQEEIRIVIRDILEQFGFEVLTAGHSSEFRSALDRVGLTAALIVLDLTLPGDVSGATWAAELRSSGYRGPLVAMTGYAEDPVISRPWDYGFDAALAKPFTVEALAETLKTLR